ncbi:MAG TPA: purine-nucleoside phosphorylase [Ignavibacteria bacterium]|nr:purine-nucleoside phosphorylase [Ignavibacteria bacterium]HMR39233.1 purine-nucleoside phosphorylase [Ignavibacteria bacterium]
MNINTGIILGSGLGKLTEELSSPELIYEDNSGFHKIKILKGKICGKDVAVFSGRRHYYEGYSAGKILENVSIAKKLGIKLLIITNAAGGLNKNFKVSDLMLITSHLNFLKIKIPKINSGPLYDKEIINKVRAIAYDEKIGLRYGSYCCLTGPVYESRSEIKYLLKYGIDAVGMSTVPEVLYANSLGIKTIAISCITNKVTEQSKNITNHDEVIEAGKNSYKNFSGLVKKIVENY